MRRLLSLLLLAAALLSLAACGAAPALSGGGEKGLSVVVTVFPLYDWVRELTKDADQVSVTLLMDSGVDMHSFQPSAKDMVLLSDCDLFVYVGGESDAWAEDALAEAKNPDLTALDLMEVLGDRAVREELAEGMQPEADEEDGDAYDEHIWLSLKNASLCCAAIADVLSRLDPDQAALYDENLQRYGSELEALDSAYAETVGAAAFDTLLFGDRFPFRYLCEDYGLTYYAAFPGCSAETEASFETVAFLAGKLDELGLPAVLILDGSDGRIAETVVASSRDGSAAVLALDSMQSVTADDIAAGTAYLAVMEQNLAVLDAALNK